MILMQRNILYAIALCVVFAPGHAAAQETAAEPLTYSPAELEELVGPIALYPDDLVAIVLPASAYPLQIVQAARLLEESEAGAVVEPDEDWDESVVALLNYPEVIEFMNQDLDWTWALGLAFINQPTDVLNAMQDFRRVARDAGNLSDDEFQIIEVEDELITIEPRSDTELYVPYYEPAQVVVRHSYPVYHYYGYPRPVYYYPYADNYSFASGYFWGVGTYFAISWINHRHSYRDYGHARHPYYGQRYSNKYRYFKGRRHGQNYARQVHVRHDAPRFGKQRLQQQRFKQQRRGTPNRFAATSRSGKFARSTNVRRPDWRRGPQVANQRRLGVQRAGQANQTNRVNNRRAGERVDGQAGRQASRPATRAPRDQDGARQRSRAPRQTNAQARADRRTFATSNSQRQDRTQPATRSKRKSERAIDVNERRATRKAGRQPDVKAGDARRRTTPWREANAAKYEQQAARQVRAVKPRNTAKPPRTAAPRTAEPRAARKSAQNGFNNRSNARPARNRGSKWSGGGGRQNRRDNAAGGNRGRR